mmetsp:Transcript_18318/g.50848  ORF Transcript_18318/g.50848 Transcript_18318/m.50848 type:complete len:219 (-) Transcript_18318:763-1419(-)
MTTVVQTLSATPAGILALRRVTCLVARRCEHASNRDNRSVQRCSMLTWSCSRQQIRARSCHPRPTAGPWRSAAAQRRLRIGHRGWASRWDRIAWRTRPCSPLCQRRAHRIWPRRHDFEPACARLHVCHPSPCGCPIPAHSNPTTSSLWHHAVAQLTDSRCDSEIPHSHLRRRNPPPAGVARPGCACTNPTWSADTKRGLPSPTAIDSDWENPHVDCIP